MDMEKTLDEMDKNTKLEAFMKETPKVLRAMWEEIKALRKEMKEADNKISERLDVLENKTKNMPKLP